MSHSNIFHIFWKPITCWVQKIVNSMNRKFFRAIWNSIAHYFWVKLWKWVVFYVLCKFPKLKFWIFGIFYQHKKYSKNRSKHYLDTWGRAFESLDIILHDDNVFKIVDCLGPTQVTKILLKWSFIKFHDYSRKLTLWRR